MSGHTDGRADHSHTDGRADAVTNAAADGVPDTISDVADGVPDIVPSAIK